MISTFYTRSLLLSFILFFSNFSFASEQDNKDYPTNTPLIEVLRKDHEKAVIRYNGYFLREQSEVSANSNVPFNPYKNSGKNTREYPRIGTETIYIGKNLIDAAPSLGGRKRLRDDTAYALSIRYRDLYQNLKNSPSIFSDLLILHKRFLTNKIVKAKLNFKYLDIPEHLHGKYQYPLLCIYFKENTWTFINKNHSMGFSSFVQALFTALLNDTLIKNDYPIQVITREGFGGVIPSTSELGNGFRLDPGLLPEKTSDLILEVLSKLDDFLSELFNKTKINSNLSILETLFSSLSTYENSGEKLKLLDRVLRNISCHLQNGSSLIHLNLKKIGKILTTTDVIQQDLLLEKIFELEVKIQEFRNLPLSSKEKSNQSNDDGYGSSSEEEWTEEEEKEEEEEEEENSNNRILKKFTFVSGMAALNIMDFTACRYSIILYRKMPNLFDTEISGPYAPHFPYFELKPILSDWRKNLLLKNELPDLVFKGIHHWNPAPNPRNIPGSEPDLESLIEIVDVTNTTTSERKKIIFDRIQNPQIPKALRKYRMLFLVSSGSKHPTGGDLVYGEAVVIGTKKAVDQCSQILNEHLNNDPNSENSPMSTVLKPSEHELRRTFNSLQLKPKNRDLK